MAVTAITTGPTGTGALYRNAVKPVGEGILLNFVKGNEALAAVGVGDLKTWIYDFEIDANYIVTSLEVTKTIASLPVTGNLGAVATAALGVTEAVTVWRVGAGTDALATGTLIAQASMTSILSIAAAVVNVNSGTLGEKVIAGVVGASSGTAAGAVLPLSAIGGVASQATTLGAAAVTTSALTNHFAAGVAADPLVKVAANGTAVGTNTKQRIRVCVSVQNYWAEAATVNPSCFIQLGLCRFSDIIQSEELVTTPTQTGSVLDIVN